MFNFKKEYHELIIQFTDDHKNLKFNRGKTDIYAIVEFLIYLKTDFFLDLDDLLLEHLTEKEYDDIVAAIEALSKMTHTVNNDNDSISPFNVLGNIYGK